MSEDNDDFELIEAEVSLEIMRAVAHVTSKNDASFSAWQNYEDAIEAGEAEFDTTKAMEIIGWIAVNDFFNEAIALQLQRLGMDKTFEATAEDLKDSYDPDAV